MSALSPRVGPPVWRRVSENITSASQSAPRPRQGHSASVLNGLETFGSLDPKELYLIILGGYDGSHLFDFLTDVWVFRTSDYSWSRVSCTGDAPCPRYRHAAVVLGSMLYVYGGFDGTNTYNDLHALNLETLLWSSLQYANNPPPPRSFRACTHVGGNKLMIFGGSQVSRDHQARTFQQFVLDLDSLRWSTVAYDGESISARSYNTISVSEDKLYLYGGYNGTTRFGDLFSFDIQKCRWQICETQDQPSGRYKHTANLVQVEIASDSKEDGSSKATDSAQRELLSRHDDLFLIIFGGYGVRWLNETVVLNLRTMAWSVPEAQQGDVPAPREGHSASFVGDKLFVFGGWSFPSYFNDVYELDLKKLLLPLILGPSAKPDGLSITFSNPLKGPPPSLSALREYVRSECDSETNSKSSIRSNFSNQQLSLLQEQEKGPSVGPRGDSGRGKGLLKRQNSAPSQKQMLDGGRGEEGQMTGGKSALSMWPSLPPAASLPAVSSESQLQRYKGRNPSAPLSLLNRSGSSSPQHSMQSLKSSEGEARSFHSSEDDPYLSSFTSVSSPKETPILSDSDSDDGGKERRIALKKGEREGSGELCSVKTEKEREKAEGEQQALSEQDSTLLQQLVIMETAKRVGQGSPSKSKDESKEVPSTFTPVNVSARDQYRILKEVERRIAAAMELHQREITIRRMERDRREQSLAELERTVEEVRRLAVQEEEAAGAASSEAERLAAIVEELRRQKERLEWKRRNSEKAKVRGELVELSLLLTARDGQVPTKGGGGGGQSPTQLAIGDLNNAIEQLADELAKKEEDCREGEIVTQRLEAALESIQTRILEREHLQREAEREAAELSESNTKLLDEIAFLRHQKDRAIAERKLLEDAILSLSAELDTYESNNHETLAVARQLKADLKALQLYKGLA